MHLGSDEEALVALRRVHVAMRKYAVPAPPGAVKSGPGWLTRRRTWEDKVLKQIADHHPEMLETWVIEFDYSQTPPVPSLKERSAVDRLGDVVR